MYAHMIKCHCVQAKRGRIEEFEAVLQFLRGKNADISKEAADIIVIYMHTRANTHTHIVCLFEFHGVTNIDNK